MATGTVLVTGASTGIGEATALRLRELGFDAVGAVRRDEDAERLRASGLRTVQLEVNVVGQVAVTQAFLPALRAGRGRIVNVSSIGGRVALPLAGAYNISKFGLEGISDALRRELRPQGVDVILVEPGGVKTPIWEKGEELAEEMLEDIPPEAERLYGQMVEKMRSETAKIATERGMEPREVADVIGEALTAERPRTPGRPPAGPRRAARGADAGHRARRVAGHRRRGTAAVRGGVGLALAAA